MEEFDICIIGGGPGGYAPAIRAAQLGAKVVLVENRELGGTCLNRGCIPTKALAATAELFMKVKEAENYGIKVENPGIDFEKVMLRKDAVVSQLVGGVEQLLKLNKVTVKKGLGRFKTKDVIQILNNGDVLEEIKAKNVIVATGSEPAKIKGFNIDEVNVLTSDGILRIDTLPSSILIVGGGVIGCEFASIFSAFESSVTVVELLPSILSTEDRNVAREMAKNFEKNGVKIYTGISISSIEASSGKVISLLTNGESIETEKVLVSIGRNFNTEGLGLENTGVKVTEKGSIIVDKYMRTNIEGIYAVGDVTGGIMLAHVATYEGFVAVNNILGKEETVDLSAVPWSIFTIPEIGTVGMKEDEAKEKGIEVFVGRFPYVASGKALCNGETGGFIKVLADAKSEKILGATAIGSHATDLIAEITLAIRNGLGIKDIAETVHSHPTMSEIVLEGVEDLKGYAIHKFGKRR